MANIMNQVMLRNRTSRNGFDLSFKNNFTSKVGEILPIFCKPVIPGDKFSISVKSFTRLQPINTAAFARMREYIDFYFVPMEQLWNKWDSVATQMKDNLMHASALNPADNVAPDGQLPWISDSQIANYINDIASADSLNEVGFSRAYGTCKLLEYLGYGDFYKYIHHETYTWTSNPKAENLVHSILPLLAYQKIYADHFRFAQWEKTNPSSFNVDYIKGINDTDIDLSLGDFQENNNFLDLRYSNFNKDLFLGVLPNPQYGTQSVVSVNSDAGLVPFNVASSGVVSSNAPLQTSLASLGPKQPVQVQAVNTGGDKAKLNISMPEIISNFSIIQLRQAEALQKWKEISQSVSEDYKSQIEAHFGVKVSDFMSHICRYLGGTTGNLDINSVVNTNITGDNPADIAGVGTVQNNGNISFESQGQYGYIIGVYHAKPLFDYVCAGVDSVTTQSNIADFPIPEFDQIGMELVPAYKLSNPMTNLQPTDDEYAASEFIKNNQMLGYAPRYVDWKTSVDVARGAFGTTLKNWVIPFDFTRLANYWFSSTNSGTYLGGSNNSQTDADPSVEKLRRYINYAFFKISPSVMNSLFAVEADSTVNTDQMLNSVFFDCKVVRNLDTNGLPY